MLPRNDEGTRIRGWIRSKTRISSVLNMKICYRHEQYSVEVQVPYLFQDNTVSSVRIVNGLERYVKESMLKPTAKARPRQRLAVTLTSISTLVLEKIWIDMETQRSNEQKFFEVSKATTRLL